MGRVLLEGLFIGRWPRTPADHRGLSISARSLMEVVHEKIESMVRLCALTVAA